jgi:hypothetical protein
MKNDIATIKISGAMKNNPCQIMMGRRSAYLNVGSRVSSRLGVVSASADCVLFPETGMACHPSFML